jgi:group I intron endonuclease
MNSGVYIITNMITGDRYIGSSKNVYIRLKCHWNLLRKNKHHNHFMQHSWNKYGESVFQYCILELTECIKEILLTREQYYINILKPEFNANPIAATRLGFKQSKETKEKIASSKIGHFVSEETRNKIRGIHPSIETRYKMSIARKNKSFSEEHKISLSRAAVGRIRGPLSEEQKAKISASLKGHPFYGNQNTN